MSKLDELLKQKAEIERQIEAAKMAERGVAIEEIVAICGRYGITYAMLKERLTTKRKRRTKAEIEAANNASEGG